MSGAWTDPPCVCARADRQAPTQPPFCAFRFSHLISSQTGRALRRLAQSLPLSAIVMETDSPDIPPHWLYRTRQQREAGRPQGRNEPSQLPRIGAAVAVLRGLPEHELADATTRNAIEAMPRLQALIGA